MLHTCSQYLPVATVFDRLLDLFRSKLVSVFLYKRSSPFENLLNQYMITGKGVYPFDPRGQGLEGTAFTVPNATLGFNGVELPGTMDAGATSWH